MRTNHNEQKAREIVQFLTSAPRRTYKCLYAIAKLVKLYSPNMFMYNGVGYVIKHRNEGLGVYYFYTEEMD